MGDGKLNRRDLFRWGAGFALGASGLWLPACKGGQGRRDAAVPKAAGAAPAGGATGGNAAAPAATPNDEALDRYGPYGAREAAEVEARRGATAGKTCSQTDANIEGPYYRGGAPFRSDLAEGFEGTPLTITGVVRGRDCKPLAAAVLDFWHADDDGHYDNDGSRRTPSSVFDLRGRVKTNAAGEYEVRTIVPGRYLNGRQYRPSHVHVKVSATSHQTLTTQLYFPDDPYNDVDPFILSSLIMNVKDGSAGAKLATFDFAL